VADAGLDERAGGEGAVAGLPVAHDGLHEDAEQRAGGAVGERAVPAHAVAVAEETRAEHVVGAPAGDGIEDPLEVPRIVFAVAVQVDGGAVASVAGELEPGANGGAETVGGFVRDDLCAVVAADRGGGIV